MDDFIDDYDDLDDSFDDGDGDYMDEDYQADESELNRDDCNDCMNLRDIILGVGFWLEMGRGERRRGSKRNPDDF